VDSGHLVVIGQWRVLLQAVTSADEICVVGYGFPSEDAYGRFLIREAARRRSKPFIRIEVYELEECFERVRNRLVEWSDIDVDAVLWKGDVKRCPTLGP
jgi:hypothetical protein